LFAAAKLVMVWLLALLALLAASTVAQLVARDARRAEEGG
jgi:hypothetical protein